MIIFRKLEAVLQQLSVDILPADGRSTLLEVFIRRSEIASKQKMAFIADKDWWVCAAIPPQYVSTDLLFTDGYSIENDVYRDGNLYSFMTVGERVKFDQEAAVVVDCYALGVSRIIKNAPGKIAVHPNEILDDPAKRALHMQLAAGEQYPTQLRENIAADFGRLLRGKTLMGLLMRQLSYAGRPARHNVQSLMEVVGNNRGPLLNSLFQQAEAIFV